MKKIWLVLAALLAFVALAIGQNQIQPKPPPNLWKPCYGCYTPLTVKPLQDRISRSAKDSTWSAAEASKQPPQEKGTRPHEDTILSGMGSFLPPDLRLNGRKKRDEKTAPLMRRRGRQRPGTRAVCRGCYSGLMIVGPPAQETRNGSVVGSHSESDGDSSEED